MAANSPYMAANSPFVSIILQAQRSYRHAMFHVRTCPPEANDEQVHTILIYRTFSE